MVNGELGDCIDYWGRIFLGAAQYSWVHAFTKRIFVAHLFISCQPPILFHANAQAA